MSNGNSGSGCALNALQTGGCLTAIGVRHSDGPFSLVEVWYMQPIEEVYKLVSGGFGTPAPPTETDLRYLIPNREGSELASMLVRQAPKAELPFRTSEASLHATGLDRVQGHVQTPFHAGGAARIHR
jgi:hypothetical protein